MHLPGYRIGERLSHTSRTSVNRAVREAGGQKVVLKRASREQPLTEEVLRLEFERHILEKLRGPGVIELVGFERVGRSPVLVLEDFEGQSLGDVPRPLGLEVFFAVATRIVEALARVHAAQVIHKDLKPSNVLWSERTGVIKLIDFQLSAEVSRERQELNVAGQLQGSLPYISPEQTGRMNRSLDYRTDYYSLGATFFELLTGTLPFQASDVMGWVYCHVSKAAPLASDVNPGVPRSLALLVHKLLSKEPSQRYQSSRGLLADLQRCREAIAAGRAEDAFELGSQDVSERFAVSQRLVGRGTEIEKLLTVFERASSGGARLLLISGYSGIGKSTVVRELLEPICAKGGYFISGKFDQLQRGVPFAAGTRAFRDLLRQLLAESELRVAGHRERILSLVGSGLSQLAELLPELTQLVGPQPPPEPLDAASAQGRFKLACTRLLQALARPEAPLVLFLDDLQWADPSTLDLLVALLSQRELSHLLVIGAFRDNEVHEGHLLTLALRQLRALAPQAVDELVLGPLSPAALTELVANTLRTSSERCSPLARLILAKSQGNPFFASELLTVLYRQGAIRLEPDQGAWTWDLAAVRSASATENVIELMLQRLAVLPEPAVAALKLAACLGHTFSVAALAGLLDSDAAAVARALWEPTREGLIVPLGNDFRFLGKGTDAAAPESLDTRFRFQHDRVQEAAYSLTAVQERAATHLRIGRGLLSQSSRPNPEELFAITNHLNLGRALISELEERVQLARLNHQAAAKAFATTSFAIAARHHDAAAACLSEEEWAARPDLRFQLFSERVSSVLMAGERERAAQLCEQLFPYAPSKAQRGRVFLAKCEVLVYQANLPEAVAAVRQGLALFGIDFPADPQAIGAGIGAGIAKMQAHLARTRIEQLPELPDATDPEVAVALQLLYNVVPAAIMIYPPLFVLAELLMFDLALTQGLAPVCAKNLVDCGMIQGQFLEDFDSAYQLGQAAFRVLDRYSARALASPVHFVFAAFVSPWRAPYDEALASCRLGMKLAVETGDELYLGYHHVLHPRLLLLLGRPLSECKAEGQSALALIDRIGGSMQSIGVRLCNRAVARLSDAPTPASEAEQADAALQREIVASGNQQWRFQYGQVQMLASVLLGDWDAAQRWSAFTRESVIAASTYLTVPEYHFLECLINARQRWAGATEAERSLLLADSQGRLDKLRGWARGCPENHAHLCALAEAELARLCEEPMQQVLALYERAAQGTRDAFVYLHALTLELESQYLRERGCEPLADALLVRASARYAAWGAAAKVARLQAQHAPLFADTAPASAEARRASRPAPSVRATLTASVKPGVLDISSVLKATQAISGEVKSERLYARLMDAMVENAAAQRGCLMLAEDGPEQLVIRARSNEGGSARPVDGVCLAIVRYVARSGEVLVIDDARDHPQFGREEYVRVYGIKSVLCVPVHHQGQLTAILYLENNATTHAFTAARVEALRVIAGQAAISIANSELYETLEQRVRDRTRQLSAKTRKIEAMLDGMRQGVFTLDSQLRVQPEVSGHLAQLVGTEDIVGRSLDELLFQGAQLSPDEQTRNEAALMVAFGSPRVRADANSAHLIREFTRPGPDGSAQVLELDWNWILGEDECVESVLVTLRDVTLLRGLAQQVAQAEREARTVAQILDAGLPQFNSFCEASRSWLASDRQRLAEPRAIGAAELQTILRHLHTIKGNARTFGLSEIVDATHAAEDACGVSTPVAQPEQRGAAQSALTRVAQLLEEHERLGERKLGRLWAASDPRLSQAMAAVEAALSKAGQLPAQPLQVLSELEHIVQRLHAVPLEQVLEEPRRILASLAQELGRPHPELEVQCTGLLLAGGWADTIKNALMHSFRNCVDHGLEPEQERRAAGKPVRGKIRLAVEQDEHGVCLRLSDDGRGLALESLRAQASRPSLSDRELAETSFTFGVSTARELSSVSGRGIGMDALRSELRRQGGDAFIEFTAVAQRGHRPFALILRLPNSALASPANGPVHSEAVPGSGRRSSAAPPPASAG
jgi:histidine kinase